MEDDLIDEGAIHTPELFEDELEKLSERTAQNESNSQP